MYAIQFSRFGNPLDVVEVVELPKPEPRPTQVIVRLEATPINPSDILTLTGQYGVLPSTFPAVPGNEGVGVIEAVGEHVSRFQVGDRVLLPIGSGTWQECTVCDEDALVGLPKECDGNQLAMLCINPMTAYAFLTEFGLKKGDWLVQNAANSAVGQYVIQMAKTMGIKTMNVVRRSELVEPLKAIGADVIVVDSDNVVAEVKEALQGENIFVAFDAIAGHATHKLAAMLSDGGQVVNYGVLSGEPIMLSPADTIFRGITFSGFWLAKWYENEAVDKKERAVSELAEKIIQNQLSARVEKVYPLKDIKQAVKHAMSGGRDGKILLSAS